MRDFVEDVLDKIQRNEYELRCYWIRFKEGRISKNEFEDVYTNSLENLIEDIQDEIYYPNNGCEYEHLLKL